MRDLGAAAEFYARAGFQVGARNTHPWGTQNHVVQFDGFFIELLTVAAPDKLTGEGLTRHFGIPNRDAIARGDGFSFLLLESHDIAADVEDFARHKIGSSPALPFTREAKLPDGGTTTIGFTLAFARDERSPQTGFALCRQSNPQAFWNSDYQRHPNGAHGVVAAILVADNPADHHIFLSAFTGVRVLQSSSTGVVASTPRGDVEIMDPRSFRDRFGVTLGVEGDGMRLAGLLARRHRNCSDGRRRRASPSCRPPGDPAASGARRDAGFRRSFLKIRLETGRVPALCRHGRA